MSVSYSIAIAGATGAVGRQLVEILAQRRFPVAALYPLASERSLGKTVHFNGSEIPVETLEDFDFSRAEIALFSAGGDVSANHVPRAAASGCIVIDNSSHFRYQNDIPLVVPEVNAAAIADYRTRNIIANPNCSTIQMLVALKPLYDAVGIRRVNVATYQAVSGAGNTAIEELAKQTAAKLSGGDTAPQRFTAQIAFNLIPQIDSFQDNGYTREEMKMVWETHKILADNTVQINPTAVRVPVFYGHSEAIYLETQKPLTAGDARQLLAAAPGICVIDECSDGGYPMPATHAAGNDEVFVGRIRDDLYNDNGLNLWVVSDNIRKGAALNAVQIAEQLAAKYL